MFVVIIALMVGSSWLVGAIPGYIIAELAGSGEPMFWANVSAFILVPLMVGGRALDFVKEMVSPMIKRRRDAEMRRFRQEYNLPDKKL